MSAVTGRLAPSPTGLLHLGNLRTLAVAWLAARAAGGRIYMRIEDLLPGMDAHVAPMLDDLRWVGLDWDGPSATDLWQPDPWPGWQGPPCSIQSRRSAIYEAVCAALLAAGWVYPCMCTRKDIDGAARAPHAEDRGVAYPGTCRGRFGSIQEALDAENHRAAGEGRAPLGVALRLRVPEAPVGFRDLLCGPQQVALPADSGDIVIRRKDGGFAYMLAVVVDDLAMGVNQVVRGDDLLAATAQQLAVYAALADVAALAVQRGDGLGALWHRAAAWSPPQHAHIPLVYGDDGRRLAKRNQSLHLRQLRAAGVAAGTLRRWLAESLHLQVALSGDASADWAAMVAAFALERMPRDPIHLDGATLATLSGGLDRA
jgi:glutamyl-tRNA synthetase